MSGLAKYFIKKNKNVFGYDREKSILSNDLTKIGAEIDYDLENIKKLLNEAPGCKVFDGHEDGKYITPIEAEGSYTTYISRIRKDNSNTKAINIWVVSDNLLKGAALNTIQIAESLMKKEKD